MKVFFIGYGITSFSGGIEYYCYNILKFLSNRDNEVGVYTYQTDLDFKPPFRFLKRRKYTDKFFLKNRIVNFLKKFRPDRIICGHLFLTPVVNAICEELGIKYDLFVYGIDCWAGKFKAYENYFSQLRYVASISNFTSQQIIKQGFSCNQIVYLPPVINTKHFVHTTTQSNKKFIILTVGRLSSQEQYKGHDQVIRAMPIIRERVPDAEYWIVGKGDDQKRLRSIATKLKLNNCVRFLGFVPDDELLKIYAQSDVFIMPSRVSLNPEKPEGEGFGIVFLEAAMMEKPLIGPNSGGSTDIIKNGYNGYNINPTSLDEIISAIMKLANDPELKIEMGKNAKKIVEENFSQNQLGNYIYPLLYP